MIRRRVRPNFRGSFKGAVDSFYVQTFEFRGDDGTFYIYNLKMHQGVWDRFLSNPDNRFLEGLKKVNALEGYGAYLHDKESKGAVIPALVIIDPKSDLRIKFFQDGVNTDRFGQYAQQVFSNNPVYSFCSLDNGFAKNQRGIGSYLFFDAQGSLIKQMFASVDGMGTSSPEKNVPSTLFYEGGIIVDGAFDHSVWGDPFPTVATIKQLNTLNDDPNYAHYLPRNHKYLGRMIMNVDVQKIRGVLKDAYASKQPISPFFSFVPPLSRASRIDLKISMG